MAINCLNSALVSVNAGLLTSASSLNIPREPFLGIALPRIFTVIEL